MDEVVKHSEAVMIDRPSQPTVKPVALEVSQQRELGFHPVVMTEDLLEPTDSETIDSFYTA